MASLFDDLLSKVGGGVVRGVSGLASDGWNAISAPRGDITLDDNTHRWQGLPGRVVSDTLDFAFGEGSLGQAALGMFTGDAYKDNGTSGPAYKPPTFTSRPEPDHLAGQPAVSRFRVTNVNGDVVALGRGGPEGSRGGGSGGPPSRTYNVNDNILAQYEQQRAALLERRNNAISAAGRGAAAPYNAAIARLDDEIKKQQDHLGRHGDYWGNKRNVNAHIYEQGAQEAAVSADEAQEIAKQQDMQVLESLSSAFSKSQMATSSVLDRIGADPATRAAAAEEVGRMEDMIYEMNDFNAKSAAELMQAAEDLAVATVKSTGASNNLELVRNQIIVEGDIKENINNMIEDRKQQVRARNAAVSAARDMAAARYPTDMPMNREGWASKAAQEAVLASMGNAPDSAKAAVFQTIQDFSYAGVSTKDARAIMRERNWENTREKPISPTTLSILGKYGLQPEAFQNFTPTQWQYMRGNTVTALNTYDHSLRYYDENFAGADPNTFQTGTMAWGMATGEQLRQTGMDEEDIRHTVMDMTNQAENGRDMSGFYNILGWAPSTSMAGSSGGIFKNEPTYEERIAGNRQRAGFE